MLTSVILIVLMLLLSAFFSGMEIAFTSKNRLKLEIDRKQSRMFDHIAEIFSRHPGQYITTILVGNNIALVIYSLYMSLLLRGIFYALGWESIARNGSVAIETAVSTVIIIFAAEFLPKSIFRNNPNFYYRALAPVIYFFYLLLYPIARLTTLISHGILRLAGRRVEERAVSHSFGRDDLAALLDTNTSEPRPEPDNEFKLFQNALDFADLRVRDCMVPRVDVEAVDIDDTSIGQLTARFVDSKYSRIFVWRKSIDNIVGYVNSKSLFTRPANIADVMMQVNFVPETMPLQLMLQNFITLARLRYVAENDQTTGLRNRNAFEREQNDIPGRCRRTLSCVYMDINGLHELNNAMGHQAGDIMLREVVDELKKQFGDELTYRMGGDEYVAFAPDLSEDRLHEKVRTFSLAIEQKDYHAALGWATCETASLRMENLLRIAETRMYQAKSAYYQDKNILPRGR